MGCRTTVDVLPTDTWSEGCIALTPYQGAYRLSGMCCEYLLLPALELTKSKLFVVRGSYHSFTGAGFSNVPIQVKGQLSADEKELVIAYSLNSTPVTHRLAPGPAKTACTCFCD
ncbi:hypothetical protein GCM10028825_23610 [Spirosoma agri]